MLRGGLDRRAVWGRMVTCICVVESLRYSPKTITTLLISYESEVKVSRALLFVTPWTAASVHRICRPEYWSGYPFPSPGNLPNPGVKPRSSTLQVDSLPSEPPGKPNSGLVYVFKRCLLPYLTLKLPFLISNEKSVLKYIQLFPQEDSTTVSKFPLST